MRGLGTIVLSAVLAVALAAQSYPPAFPRTNATKLMETDRIVVWDIVWPKGQPTPMHQHVHDQVGTYYATGGRAITTPDGVTRQTTTPVGGLSTTRKGTTHIEEGTTDPPLRAVFIELKQDTGSGVAEAPSQGAAAAFPREGAKQLLDDERVTVWDYTWMPGVRQPIVRYTRDSVVVWLDSGTMRETTDGKLAATVAVAPGQMRYHSRGSGEIAEAIDGSPRAMIFAFK
jgi:predicted metal-dependent enzyme (double-stranded beta helix superfamily)